MKNQNGNIQIYTIAVFSMLFWGLSFIWTKIVFEYYQPLTTIFLRLLLSSVILFTFLFFTGNLQRIQRSDRKNFLITALFSPFIYFIGENFGLQLVNPTLAAVIIATIPLFTPFVANAALREKITWSRLAGIAISFAGIMLMIYYQGGGSHSSFGGVLLLFLAVAAAIGYSVFIKRLTHQYNSITIIAWQNAIGALLFLPLFLAMDAGHFITVAPTRELVLALLQLAFFASSLAYIFFVSVIRAIGVTRSNVMSNLIPVFTAIFSYFIIGEVFTLKKIAGMSLVIAGVVISQLARMQEGKKHPL